MWPPAGVAGVLAQNSRKAQPWLGQGIVRQTPGFYYSKKASGFPIETPNPINSMGTLFGV